MEILQLLKEWWAFISTAVIAVSGGYYQYKANKQKSSTMLYEQLEALKIKVINQIKNEVASAHKVAEIQTILEGLKAHCPDCYSRFLKENNNGVEENTSPN